MTPQVHRQTPVFWLERKIPAFGAASPLFQRHLGKIGGNHLLAPEH
jgi:hypothetical protein